ncbi:MAG TPA: dipeptide/oligopeptide/nickel ABC transporter ATP-binding protein [Polyangiaceae bacterium]|jgi:peptide/nickel transport system ATP-binding protein|nr:dipeptide/oligopeptide/nickel ABC transporter ATP-binding protein [Polyangiaceae bacterium]
MPAETFKFEAKDVSRVFGHGKRLVTAVDRVSFKIKDREIVSLVGQSGCGKTVLAKMLLRLEAPSSGTLLFDGKPIDSEPDPREHWRKVQAVFQDPFSAFNQFFTIRAQLKSSFNLFKQKPAEAEMEERVDQALLAVNIKPKEVEGKYPFELSGGQMQRMLLARIFILRPQVLIADEPTSMVDACSRASILDYLMKLKEELKMTIVFVTHDIGLAYYISDSIYIMHKGQIVEQGPPDQVTLSPTSEVTKQLLDDIPNVHHDWLHRGPPGKKSVTAALP